MLWILVYSIKDHLKSGPILVSFRNQNNASWYFFQISVTRDLPFIDFTKTDYDLKFSHCIGKFLSFYLSKLLYQKPSISKKLSPDTFSPWRLYFIFVYVSFFTLDFLCKFPWLWTHLKKKLITIIRFSPHQMQVTFNTPG